jgi:hypothetical protein
MEQFSSRPLQYSLQYHTDQDPDLLRQFWAEELNIDPGTITLQRKSNSGGLAARSWRSHHGVLTIGVSDTYFRAELQAWIDGIRADWEDNYTRPNGA